MKKLLPFMVISLLLGWCNLLPSTVSDNHDHTTEELTNPNHHDMTWHEGHTMDHAAMVTDEISFLSEMIPHHQEAIDTSSILLTQTQNTGLKLILVNIMSGQAHEIKMMKERLSDSYSGSDYKSMYMPMMRDTTWISDIVALEKMYMEDMIAHHQWAVDMATKLLSIMTQQDPAIKLTEEGMKQRQTLKDFAQGIIDAQTKEITQFQEMLKIY